ncbi:hypothetical protein VTL71DRAFT_2508 [Oculimacula yallundae]|uniref:Uncharacterized protein n=1 Tax=Oculimacula yallundae TaxID=86028 RepID=A0ABR4CA91_9HELO
MRRPSAQYLATFSIMDILIISMIDSSVPKPSTGFALSIPASRSYGLALSFDGRLETEHFPCSTSHSIPTRRDIDIASHRQQLLSSPCSPFILPRPKHQYINPSTVSSHHISQQTLDIPFLVICICLSRLDLSGLGQRSGRGLVALAFGIFLRPSSRLAFDFQVWWSGVFTFPVGGGGRFSIYELGERAAFYMGWRGV